MHRFIALEASEFTVHHVGGEILLQKQKIKINSPTNRKLPYGNIKMGKNHSKRENGTKRSKAENLQLRENWIGQSGILTKH